MKTVIEKILIFVLKAMLNKRSPMFLQRQALSIIDTWANARGIRYMIAADIQSFLSQISGYSLCEYCQWVVWPGEPHDECQQALAQEQMFHPGFEQYDYCQKCGARKVKEACFCWHCGSKFLSTEERAAQQKAEIRAGWAQWDRLHARCPCGHERQDHAIGKGHCEISGCICTEFGDPGEAWETKREADIDAAWEQYRGQKQAEIETAYQDIEEGLDEEPEEFTEVIFGESPGGLRAYE